MNKSQNLLLQSLSHAIWDGEYITEEKLNEEVRQEAIQQTVLPLLCSGKSSLQVISSNVQLLHEQSELGELLKGIPYVILKGTAAEIYYPEPLR